MLQGRVTLAFHGVELEDRVEVHELNTGHVIHLFLRDDMLQVVVHRIKGDGISVGTRVAQDSSVLANAHEVNAPGVDTDTGDLQSATCHFLQSTNNLEVERIDVPIVMTSLFDEVIGKTRHFFQFKTIVFNVADDGATTRCAKIDSKEILFLLHD